MVFRSSFARSCNSLSNSPEPTNKMLYGPGGPEAYALRLQVTGLDPSSGSIFQKKRLPSSLETSPTSRVPSFFEILSRHETAPKSGHACNNTQGSNPGPARSSSQDVPGSVFRYSKPPNKFLYPSSFKCFILGFHANLDWNSQPDSGQ